MITNKMLDMQKLFWEKLTTEHVRLLAAATIYSSTGNPSQSARIALELEDHLKHYENERKEETVV